MVSKLSLIRGREFEPPFYNLNICYSFVCLKVHKNSILFVSLFVCEYEAELEGEC